MSRTADLYERLETLKCQCERCQMEHLGMRMLMPSDGICGNKRCPKAQWHGYRCTGSNEPNQVCVPEDIEPAPPASPSQARPGHIGQAPGASRSTG